MPPHLRRRGSGLLQNPRPGLLPSPNYARLGPLGPSRVVLSTRPSSCPLRPAATFLLASPPSSHPTSENSLPGSSGGLPGRDSHPLVDRPFAGHATTRTPASSEVGAWLCHRPRTIGSPRNWPSK